jgi:hypothetical protein
VIGNGSRTGPELAAPALPMNARWMTSSLLDRVFVRTAIMALVVALVGLTRVDALWAARFSTVVLTATLSWWCSATALRAATQKREFTLMAAVFGKIWCLMALFLGIALLGFEITSFLAGLNLYLLAWAFAAFGEAHAPAKAADMAPGLDRLADATSNA